MYFNIKHLSTTETIGQCFYNQDSIMKLEIRDNLELYLNSRPPSVGKVLKFLLNFCNRHNGNLVMWPSQINIAHALGYNKDTIYKAIKILKEDGFLISRRQYNSSCRYKLSSFFGDSIVRAQIINLLSIFCLSALIVCKAAASDDTYLVKKQGLFGNVIINSTHRRVEVFEEPMKQFSQRIYGQNPISPRIRSLNSIYKLNFTQYAMMKFTPFPDEAIKYTVDKLQYAKNVKDPYNWIFKMSLDYCTANDIIPDWNYAATLIVSHNLTTASPIYLNRSEQPLMFTHTEIKRPTAIATKPHPSRFKAVQVEQKQPVKPKEYVPDTRRRFGNLTRRQPLTSNQLAWASQFPVPQRLTQPDRKVE